MRASRFHKFNNLFWSALINNINRTGTQVIGCFRLNMIKMKIFKRPVDEANQNQTD